MKVIMADLVNMWDMLRFGFSLGWNAKVQFTNHPIWADNLLRFAKYLKELPVMIDVVKAKLHQAGFRWKPRSVKTITGGSLRENKTEIKSRDVDGKY